MKHDDFWRGIDALAQQRGISASRLAMIAGLDPTTFNRSKRTGPDGIKPRWLSTESLGKVLDATDLSLEEFAHFATGENQLRSAPLIGLAQAGSGGFFDDSGFPVGHGWDQVQLPEITDESTYVLQISGDSMEPIYRDSDYIVVVPNARIKHGDRVVVKTRDGEILAKELAHRGDQMELISFNPSHTPMRIARDEIEWMARIVWASQ